MRPMVEVLRSMARQAYQRALTYEPVILISLLGAVLMAVLSIGELLGLNQPAVGTVSLIFDLAFAVLFAALTAWMIWRPAALWPRWLMIVLVSMGFGVALFTIKLPGVMVFLISAPVLIAILATGRLYPILSYPLILAFSLAANPVAQLVITPLMVTLELVLFVMVWNLYARAGLAARRQTEAEARLRQAQATRDFVRFFAHEIKGYASGLAGLAPLLTQLVAEAEQRREQGDRLLEGFNIVVEETNTLMEQLLLLSREGVLPTQHYQPIPLRTLLERLLRELRLMARGLPLALEIEVDIPAASIMHGQPVYLALALGSVLRNALEAAVQAGHATLTLTITTCLESGEQVLRIADSGPGFPPQILKALASSDASLLLGSSSKAGGGLGLPLLLQVARLHQGRILAGNASMAGQAWLELRIPSHQALFAG